MEIKLLFRGKSKLPVCFAVFFICAFCTMLFAVQYIIDSICLKYTKEAYVSVGTAYKFSCANPAYTSIDSQAISLIENSVYVGETEVRETLSAKLPGFDNVPCFFSVPQTNHLIFFSGTIDDCIDVPKDIADNAQCAAVSTANIYAGQSNWIRQGDKVTVLIISDEKKPDVRKGEKYFFIAQSAFADISGELDATLYAFNRTIEHNGSSGDIPESAKGLFHDTVITLPEGITDDEEAVFINKIIEERGLKPYITEISYLDDVYTVHKTNDMGLLLPVFNEIMFFTQRRGIMKKDAAEKVCVISREAALLHNLKPGDFIPISLGNGCYTVNGYETGFPAFGDMSSACYSTPENYEVIGIYTYSTFDPGNASLLFGYNDIFIPADDEPNRNIAYPYSFSFRVNGSDYDAFIDNIVPDLAQIGYTVQMTASKWKDAAPIYNAMARRRSLSLFMACAVFTVGALIGVSLIFLLYRREFALRTLFGAPFKHIVKSYINPFLVSSSAAVCLSGIAAYIVYVNKLLPKADAIAPGCFPNKNRVWILLLLLGALMTAFSLIIILIIAKRSEKFSVRKLLK